MRRVQAIETLENPDRSSRLTIEGFYNLLLEAGYSEKLAQQAANQRGWNRLDAGSMM